MKSRFTCLQTIYQFLLNTERYIDCMKVERKLQMTRQMDGAKMSGIYVEKMKKSETPRETCLTWFTSFHFEAVSVAAATAISLSKFAYMHL